VNALVRTACAAALAAAVPAAIAQIEFETVRLDDAPAPGAAGTGRWGGGIGVGQRYLGSDETRIVPLPIVEYRWTSGWFAGTGTGVGYAFSSERALRWGVRAGIDFGRRERRSDALRGMGDVDPSPTIGAYYNRALVQGLGLDSSVRVGANGALADIGLHWSTTLAPTTALRLGVAATLADERYMQKYFGVSAEQAARSGYAQTDASAGVRDTRASVSLLQTLGSSLVLTGTVTLRSLSSDAASSPLTRDTSSVTALVTLTTAF
jgi:outer membrane scaffolding protein for murein synthesis (MipA/OmpV family)